MKLPVAARLKKLGSWALHTRPYGRFESPDGRESSFVLVELARFSSLPGGGIRVFGTVLVQSVFMTSTPAGEFTEEVKTGDSVQRSPLA